MAHLNTYYDDDFNRKLESQKKAEKNAVDQNLLSAFAKRVGRMTDSGAGVTWIDLERYIGSNDLLRFNYLSRGVLAGKAVCRIYIADKFGGGGAWGTGFLITPSLIITNNHVIPDDGSAARAFAEFGYEADDNGVLLQGKRFKLQPERTFITSLPEQLDLTIVAIAPVSDDGLTPINNYGFLRMNPGLNKIDELEFVSIIQHPGGDEKFISIRENKVIKIGDDNPARDTRIWYESDTAKGSSGAAVFNDQWQVVALHHSGVAQSREVDGKTEVQLVNGNWVPKNEEDIYDDHVSYIANEGIRTSRIVQHVQAFVGAPENQQLNLGILKEFLDDVLGVKPITITNVKDSIVSPATAAIVGLEVARRAPSNIWPVEHYAGRIGYVESFLGVMIPFPVVTSTALQYGAITVYYGDSDHPISGQIDPGVS